VKPATRTSHLEEFDEADYAQQTGHRSVPPTRRRRDNPRRFTQAWGETTYVDVTG
jgi:hypothetical protein